MTTEGPKSSWTYHPLDGEELLKWIMADIWQKIQHNGQFGKHLVYHNPTYALKLEILAHDGAQRGAVSDNSAPAGATGSVTTEIIGGLVTTLDPLEGKEKNRIVLDVSSDAPLKEPDRARELLDEGRYKTVSEEGVLVDRKVKKEKK